MVKNSRETGATTTSVVNGEVSESSGAVCQLPLTAPAGTSGMAPKLSLGYNSQGSNRPLGVGWSLEWFIGHYSLSGDASPRWVD